MVWKENIGGVAKDFRIEKSISYKDSAYNDAEY